MTNDEILKTLVSPDHALLYPDFLRAMDAAREDEAVGFAEWVEGSAYRRKLNGMWYDSISGSANSKLYSTDELYQLYLKHKNEKK